MRRFLLLLAFCLVIFFLGSLSWPVTRPFNWMGDLLWQKRGWDLKVAQARWVPWGELSLKDLIFRTAQGGRLHIEEIKVRSHPGSLVKGSLATRWSLRDIRIDPASWGIRKPLAQELLSAGPIAHKGSAVVKLGLTRVLLQAFTLQGSMIQFHAEGWMNTKRQADFRVGGSFWRRLLEGMELVEPDPKNPEAWEPFSMRLNGTLRNPEFSFESKFYSIYLKMQQGQSL